MARSRYSIAFLVTVTLAQTSLAAPSLTVEVDAGSHARINTPVNITLSAKYQDVTHFELTRIEDGTRIPVQRTPHRVNARLFWILQKPLAAGHVRRYHLRPLGPDAAQPAAQVTCDVNAKRLLVKVGTSPVLQYNHAILEAPNTLDPKYRRSGHIHPIYNPSGQSLTDDFPPDHAHQHGLFFPWVRTRHGQHDIDFWNQMGETGIIEHTRFLGKATDGHVFAQFSTELMHRDITSKDQPVDVLRETRVIRVFRTPGYFLFDVESYQNCISKDPLIVKQYHYGGLAIRGNRQWFKEDTATRVREFLKSKPTADQLADFPVPRDYLTSEGKTWANGNQTRARWVEMHGQIDGKPTGITLMCHPNNFRAPQPVRLHPHKPYFCFAPMQLGDFEIRKGRTFASRYRFYAHDGPVDTRSSERHWQDYAQPARVRIVAVNP